MNPTRAFVASLATLCLLVAGCGATSETSTPVVSTATSTASEEQATAMEDSAAPEGATEDTPEPSMSQPKPDQSSDAGAEGAYIAYEDYSPEMVPNGQDVVLFFHAAWCPSCKAADESLSTEGVPDGLTVVKVDYDSMTELRTQYGITQQHTFVQVDEQGNQLAKWSGSNTGSDIAAQLV